MNYLFTPHLFSDEVNFINVIRTVIIEHSVEPQKCATNQSLPKIMAGLSQIQLMAIFRKVKSA